MSVNNFYFAKEIDGTWYGWDLPAEKWGDHNKNNPIKVHLMRATVADSIEELESKLDREGIGYSEYGLIIRPYLPKDNTPIEVVI